MSLVSLGVRDVILYDWETGDYQKSDYFKPNNKDTYMVVFGPGQERQFNFFQKELAKDYNILYEAPKAFNKRYRTGPRNTLIIFETKDE